jgi:16S rRNA (guanine1207-N2)-methyltransferase
VDGDMSSKFLVNTKRLLSHKGRALFVVNAFIPLAQKAQKYFTSVDEIGNNGSFKVIALSH